MKKIVFVGYRSPFLEQVKDAFLTQGLEIIGVNDRLNWLVPKPLRENTFLWRVIRKSPTLKAWSNQRFNRELVKTIEREQPECLFVAKGMIVSPSTLQLARKRGILTVNWFVDNVYHPRYRNWFAAHFEDYDYVLSFDSSVVEQFPSRTTKVFYVPVGIDDKMYSGLKVTAEDHVRYDCDVCFVGAAYPERVSMLSTLTDYDLRIYGWEGWRSTPLSPWYHGPLSPHEAAKLYACAKVSLNMNIEPATKGVNLKTFEIPAAGGFQLSDWRADVNDLFEVGKEIAIFDQPELLRESIRYYIDRLGERGAIAAAGHTRAMRDHTIAQRVRDIIKIITKEPSA